MRISTRTSEVSFLNPVRYLLPLAAVLHLVVVLSLYSIGRATVVPQQVDERGTLIGPLPDGITYQHQATIAVHILSHAGIRSWLDAPFDAHVKLYSLSFLILGPSLGNNILSAEPFNLGCYLTIILLVFVIGREVFDESVGQAAALTTSIWPSLLVHSAQILKDPICAIAMLLLMLMMVFWLTRRLSWLYGMGTGLTGATAIGLIYATRGDFWVPVILGLVLIGAGLLMGRQLRERSLLAGNVLSGVMILLMSIAGFSLTDEFLAMNWFQNAGPPATLAPEYNQAPPVTQRNPGNNPIDVQGVSFPLHPRPERTNHIVNKIQQVRDSFAYRYRNSGTLIDPDVEFITSADVIRYLPRAMAVGFLAPFPDKWVSPGREVGLTGRLISGAEMFVTYLLELFALWGLWQSRYRFSAWFLTFATIFGVTVLALGVINVGALYRMRYGFFVLLIVLGMNGLIQIRLAISNSKVSGGVSRSLRSTLPKTAP